MTFTETESPLSTEERARYARHLTLPGFGESGQAKLKAARVLIVGLGGLGSPAAMYLAAAGVGTLGLVEFDTVERSNLQRQLLFGESDLGEPKLRSAASRLGDINPHVRLEAHAEGLSEHNAVDLVRDYDLVLDGTDNFTTRYLINDACVLTGTPNVFASIFRFDAQLSIFAAPEGPCYRCLFPQPPAAGTVPNCADGGVLGVLPGVAGVLQATEAIKFITGIGTPLVGKLLMSNLLVQSHRTIQLRRDEACPVCGNQPSITEVRAIEELCDYPQASGDKTMPLEVSVQDLKAKMDQGESFILLDVREPFEFEKARIPQSTLVPLGQIEERMAEFDKAADIVVHCKMGGRSMQAAQMMEAAGFSNVKNLSGGINAWSLEIDSNVPTY